MENGRKGFKGRDYFSGFDSLVLSLRGWGGVPSNLRKTSSGFGSAILRLVGFSGLSFIRKSSQNQTTKPVIKIDPTKLREGSWELWEWLGEEVSIEFIDEILLKVIKVIFGDTVDLQDQVDPKKEI